MTQERGEASSCRLDGTRRASAFPSCEREVLSHGIFGAGAREKDAGARGLGWDSGLRRFWRGK